MIFIPDFILLHNMVKVMMILYYDFTPQTLSEQITKLPPELSLRHSEG